MSFGMLAMEAQELAEEYTNYGMKFDGIVQSRKLCKREN